MKRINDTLYSLKQKRQAYADVEAEVEKNKRDYSQAKNAIDTKSRSANVTKDDQLYLQDLKQDLYLKKQELKNKIFEAKRAADYFAYLSKNGEIFNLLEPNIPIVLFPVRIETKFCDSKDGKQELRIRIFPDDIAISNHQEQLTKDEKLWGEWYWRQLTAPPSEEDTKRDAWRVLFEKFGSERAAWIVKVIETENNSRDELNEESDNSIRNPGLTGFPAMETNKDSDNKNHIPESKGSPEKELTSREAQKADDTIIQTPKSFVLPDFWMVLTPKNGESDELFEIRATSKAIPEKLQVGPCFDSEDETNWDEKLLDEGSEWLINFDKAEEVGMAIRIQLENDEYEKGFKKLFVFGVRASADPTESTNLFEKLIENHHYTEGFSFLPQGTPTNNTEEAASGYSSQGLNFEESYETEILTSDLKENSSGQRLAQAFGINSDVFQHIEHTGVLEDTEARAMASALWPATLGYYLKQMLVEGALSDESINKIREHFVNYVRGQGPLSAIRVGSMPYGILPITSLQKLTQLNSNSEFERNLYDLLIKLFRKWLEMSERVPQVGKSDDPEQELLDILGMEAASSDYCVRFQGWEGLIFIFYEFINKSVDLDYSDFWGNQIEQTILELGSLGIDPSIFRSLYYYYTRLELGERNIGFTDFQMPFCKQIGIPLIDENPLSNSEVLGEGENENYITWLSKQVNIDDVRADRFYSLSGIPEKEKKPLLYLILKYAWLREYENSANDISDLALLESSDKTFIFSNPTKTIWQLIDKKYTATGGKTLKNYMELELAKADAASEFAYTGRSSNIADLRAGFVTSATASPEKAIEKPSAAYDDRIHNMTSFKDNLRKLESLSVDRLEQLLTETLDLCSHRLDAWITSLATEKLFKIREKNPTGIYLGAYGWVENLKPNNNKSFVGGGDIEQLDLPDDSIVRNAINSGGYIHAPSLNHAIAASVLRNGFLAHSNTDNQEEFAINLNSDRVRRSLWIFEGIRQGQSLGALFGYRFERGLHEKGENSDTKYDKYIYVFRDLYPLAANTPTENASEPREAISARNVVDGLQLLKGWKANDSNLDFINRLEENEKEAIIEELNALDEIFDGLADLGIAESVYQSVQGKFAGAGGILDAVNFGKRPPEPEIAKTPRSGIRYTHRVVIVTDETEISTGWANTPRAKVSPHLNSWVGKLLGDPNKIKCSATVKRYDGSRGMVPVTLADLKLSPLDFISLTATSSDSQATELERRIEYFVRTTGEAIDLASQVTVNFKRQNMEISLAPYEKIFLDSLQKARVINNIVSNSRALNLKDFTLPEEVDTQSDIGLDDTQVEIGLTMNDITELKDKIMNDCLGESLESVDELEDCSDDFTEGFRQLVDKITNYFSDKVVFDDFDDTKLLKCADCLQKASYYGVSGSIPLFDNEILRELFVGSTVDIENAIEQATKKFKTLLWNQGQSVVRELLKRKEKIDTIETIINSSSLSDPSSSSSKIIEKINEVADILFARSVKLLPRFSFTANTSNELNSCLSKSDEIGLESDTLKDWMNQVALVRSKLDQYKMLQFYLETFGHESVKEWNVIQLPYLANDRWIGLPFRDDLVPEQGKISIIGELPDSVSTIQKIAGFIIDEWVETIPSKEQMTGVAFHYNQPSQEAPQAILLAVPSSENGKWEWEDLAKTLNETLNLAKIRAVNYDLVAEKYGYLLPALYFATNLENETISVDFFQNEES